MSKKIYPEFDEVRITVERFLKGKAKSKSGVAIKVKKRDDYLDHFSRAMTAIEEHEEKLEAIAGINEDLQIEDNITEEK